MITLPEMPKQIATLPRDVRGYPIPYFVPIDEHGKPDFRLADGRKRAIAIQEQRCWICGEKLKECKRVFVIGPMSMISRVCVDAPSHPECAIFSVKACPFLINPQVVRKAEGGEAVGTHVDHNPGVFILWYVKTYGLSRGENGALFQLANPARLDWYREGRKATGAEIRDAFKFAVDEIVRMAAGDSNDSKAALLERIEQAMLFVPKS